jgi:hypothetical protein
LKAPIALAPPHRIGRAAAADLVDLRHFSGFLD